MRAQRGIRERGRTSPSGHELAALGEQRGYRFFARSPVTMEIDLDAAPPDPSCPHGLDAPARTEAEDREAVRAALNEAFADDWYCHDGRPRTSGVLSRGTRGFDPALWQSRGTATSVAGSALAFPERGGDAGLGWVGTLGVRRARGAAAGSARRCCARVRRALRPRPPHGSASASTRENRDAARSRLVRARRRCAPIRAAATTGSLES